MNEIVIPLLKQRVQVVRFAAVHTQHSLGKLVLGQALVVLLGVQDEVTVAVHVQVDDADEEGSVEQNAVLDGVGMPQRSLDVLEPDELAFRLDLAVRATDHRHCDVVVAVVVNVSQAEVDHFVREPAEDAVPVEHPRRVAGA